QTERLVASKRACQGPARPWHAGTLPARTEEPARGPGLQGNVATTAVLPARPHAGNARLLGSRPVARKEGVQTAEDASVNLAIAYVERHCPETSSGLRACWSSAGATFRTDALAHTARRVNTKASPYSTAAKTDRLRKPKYIELYSQNPPSMAPNRFDD